LLTFTRPGNRENDEKKPGILGYDENHDLGGVGTAPDEKLATSKMPLAKKRTCRKGAIGVKISRISKG